MRKCYALIDMAAFRQKKNAVKPLWLCLRFPYLSMNAVDVRFAHPQATAITHQQSIYLVNRVAAKSAVQPEQSIGHALMVNPELRLFEHDVAQTARKLKQLSHWAYHFSSQIKVHDEQTLLLEVGRSLTLFKGLKHLQHLLSYDLEKLAVDVVYGLANTPKAAHLLSFEEQGHWDECNINRQLSNASLVNLAVDKKTLNKLINCGFSTLSDVLAIPRKEISHRFDQAFVRYLEQLLGQVADPQMVTLPPEQFSQRIDFAEPIHNRNWIEQQINRLLKDLVTFMQERNLVCRNFHWRFYSERNRLLKQVTINLASTHSDFDTYRQLTDLQFANLSMRWEFSSIQLTSDSLVQRQQFHNDLFDPRSDQEGIHQFIQKLTNRLGHQALYKISAEPEHIPELASQHCQVSRHVASDHIRQSTLKDEPLCLLENPKRLRQAGGKPVHEGELNLIHGPHRISSHWWENLQSRDYYIARKSNGILLWVYYDRGRSDWYLHGLFA